MADKPELRAFTVNQYGSGQNRSTRWTEIGAAWRTQKGHLRIPRRDAQFHVKSALKSS